MSCAYLNYPPQGLVTPCENSWPVARVAAKTTETLTTLGSHIGEVPIGGWIPLEDSVLLMGQDDSTENGLYTISEDETAPNLLEDAEWATDPTRNAQCSVTVDVTIGQSYYVAGDWSSVSNGIEEFGYRSVVYAATDKMTVYASNSLALQPVVGKIKPAKLVRTQPADESRDFWKGKSVSVMQGPNAGRYMWRWEDSFNLGTSPVYFDQMGVDNPGPPLGFTRELPQAFAMVCIPPTANVAPTITVHPTSQLLKAGWILYLKVEASGSTPLTYQWFKDGVPMPGFTQPSWTNGAVALVDEGDYFCRVSNSAGAINSQIATVAIAYAPVITNQPQNQDVATGGSAAFSVTVAGTAPFTYQWYKDSVVIPGATASSYAVTNAQAAAYFKCVIKNKYGSVTSNDAFLSLGISPSIIIHPKSQTGTSGDQLTLSVTAQGTAPLTYQWYFKGLVLASATTAAIQIEIKGTTEGDYKCLVRNKYGTVWSDTAILTMDQANRPPIITTQPQDQNGNVGNNIMLFVVAQGTPPLAYQWMKGGVDLPGKTGSSLSLPNVQLTDAGDYSVKITNAYGNATSETGTLTVVAAGGSPIYLGNAGQDLKAAYTSTEIMNLQQTLPQVNPTTRTAFAGTYEISRPASNQNEYRVIAAPESYITGTVTFRSAEQGLPMTTVQTGLDIAGVPYRVYRTSGRSVGDFTVAGATAIVVTQT